MIENYDVFEKMAKGNSAIIECETDKQAILAEIKIISQDEEVYIYCPRYGDKYLAYNLNTRDFPDGLYSDLRGNNDTLDARLTRHKEIIENTRLFLENKIEFNERKSVFGKVSKYAEIYIDGNKTKIWA